MLSSFENLRGWYAFVTCCHKGFHYLKYYYKNNSPIITANPWDELTVFGKIETSPQVRYWWASSVQHSFPKITLHKILISQVPQCISFIPIIVKCSLICAQQPSTYIDTILARRKFNALALTIINFPSYVVAYCSFRILEPCPPWSYKFINSFT
jgi:hypothetical protein